MPLRCSAIGNSLPITYNACSGILLMGYDSSYNQVEDISSIQPSQSSPPVFSSSGLARQIGATAVGIPDSYKDVGVAVIAQGSIFRIPVLDSLSPEIEAGFTSAQAIVRIQDVTWVHVNQTLFTNSTPGGVLLDNGLYWYRTEDSDSGAYTGDIGIGLMGWKLVGGELRPYILSSDITVSSFTPGKYSALDATCFIASYLAAKSVFAGFSFFLSGEAFSVPFVAGDDALSVALSVLGQYASVSLAYEGMASGHLYHVGTLDTYRWEWSNPAINQIEVHFDSQTITITQDELFGYGLIPQEV